ncbi:male-specific lethal 1-like 1 [Clupea harengus]|uniref:Male-specific lethal 1-like 1 n=1 Tax=Clupea harengus TaxID=7950 RepID=A0A6P8G6W5_CLUHA|nr:male-specific lethal 1-like 1 [Clupea harengus]XP_012697326.2 male-specific lethal 1-like 1 [Clupea harengus]XP_031431018.1 male-specific lethal 1-like 1 [Clupea harengus]XP_031431025.1 male-specific lethal 1-like 1 [Clupea harengus]
MRSTLLTSGGLHLDAGALDLGLTEAAVQDFLAGQEEDTRHFIHTLPNLIGTFQHTSGPILRNKARGSTRTFGCRPGQSLVFGEGHLGLFGSFGALTTPFKQMGGEGILVNSKSLFGHANKSMGKMDPVVSNGNKQPQDADDVSGGAGLGVLLGGLPLPSPEPCPEGKRRNIRKGPNHSAAQTNCIRQILLLQLELIEQQQQQLQSKNHEINELKEEKETLMARIEQMERRLQHTVKKDKPRKPQPPTTSTRRKEPEPLSETPEGPGLSQNRLHTPKQPYFGRGGKGHKRRFLSQEPRVGRFRRGGGPRSPLRKVIVFKEEEDGGEEYNEEEKEERGAFSLQSSPSSVEDVALAQQMQELPYLASTDMYLCCWHPPPVSSSPWHDPSPTQEDTVDVPSWRENTVAPLGEKEAANVPESLEDRVFRKRHIKLELEEKRRKRWDIQRIREQRIFQRLQQRMNKKKATPEPESHLQSFYPEAEDVESITITPFLPVVAFGRPLPNIKQQNFELPWLDECERVRSRPEVSVKKKKKTPHRTCRK